MATGLAEELLQQLAAAVGHLRLVDEPVVGLDERADAHHADHAREVAAELVAEHREAVEDALAGSRLGRLEAAGRRHRARGHERAVTHRQLPRDVDEVPRTHRRHVGRDRLGGGGERQAEGSEVLVEGHGPDRKAARRRAMVDYRAPRTGRSPRKTASPANPGAPSASRSTYGSPGARGFGRPPDIPTRLERPDDLLDAASSRSPRDPTSSRGPNRMH